VEAAVRGAERGFSLTELLASLALLSLALLAAWDLWDDSIRLVGTSGRALRNPSSVPATTALRHDLQAALELPAPAVDWSSTDLEVRLAGDRLVRYERRGEALYRLERGVAGTELAQRRVSTSVAGWQWRTVAPGLVEVRLTLDLYPDPSPVSRKVAVTGHGRRVRHTDVLRVAARGSGGGSSW
jgi:prepilin-type N-terminal cleavage/methylation domain-containing protein